MIITGSSNLVPGLLPSFLSSQEEPEPGKGLYSGLGYLATSAALFPVVLAPLHVSQRFSCVTVSSQGFLSSSGAPGTACSFIVKDELHAICQLRSISRLALLVV